MTTQLPVLAEAEMETMVATLVHMIDRVAEMLMPEAAHRYFRNDLRERLRQGTIEAMKVIALARAGSADADLALRELIAEMIGRKETIPTSLEGYAQEALLRAPVTYPAGRNFLDNWTRDVAVAILVAFAILHWPPLKPTATEPPSGPAPPPLWRTL